LKITKILYALLFDWSHNIEQIFQAEDFKLQPESVIYEIISKAELHVVCESKVVNAVLKWIKYDFASRQYCLNALIKNISIFKL